mmetsp:Transcript_11908/g.41769  ORF Transcript_11908/g.41769 Transcript_11908/m.41769 type:complete len:278 (+) Transcript_11908:133-966(+)
MRAHLLPAVPAERPAREPPLPNVPRADVCGGQRAACQRAPHAPHRAQVPRGAGRAPRRGGGGGARGGGGPAADLCAGGPARLPDAAGDIQHLRAALSHHGAAVHGGQPPVRAADDAGEHGGRRGGDQLGAAGERGRAADRLPRAVAVPHARDGGRGGGHGRPAVRRHRVVGGCAARGRRRRSRAAAARHPRRVREPHAVDAAAHDGAARGERARQDAWVRGAVLALAVEHAGDARGAPHGRSRDDVDARSPAALVRLPAAAGQAGRGRAARRGGERR